MRPGIRPSKWPYHSTWVSIPSMIYIGLCKESIRIICSSSWIRWNSTTCPCNESIKIPSIIEKNTTTITSLLLHVFLLKGLTDQSNCDGKLITQKRLQLWAIIFPILSSVQQAISSALEDATEGQWLTQLVNRCCWHPTILFATLCFSEHVQTHPVHMWYLNKSVLLHLVFLCLSLSFSSCK